MIIPRGVRGQKVAYTVKFLLTAATLNGYVGSIMIGYQPGPRSMAGLVAYSLTQWSARTNTCRAAVCSVSRHMPSYTI